MAAAQNTVATPCHAHREMSCEWKLIDDLSGGTAAMRRAGKEWLPQEDAESDDTYSKRLKRSFLYEILKDTRRRLASRPFSEPVKLSETLPERLAGMEKNVDGLGQDVTQFARQAFDANMGRGLVHTLVDYPDLSSPGETNEERRDRVTLEDEYLIHPIFTHITADDLLGWETAADPVLGRYTTLIRFRECVLEKDPGDEWSECLVEQIRVVEAWKWRVYRKNKDGDWGIFKEGTRTLGEVGVRTWYTNRTGHMTAESPLRALAWLNLQHWCSSSDQNNILRFARFGTLFGSGFTDDEVSKGIVLGPSRLLRSKNKDAKLVVVEHSGAAIGAGRQDLLDIEARAEVLGLAPLMERSGGVTATGRAIDESRTTCDVLAWVIAGEQHLLECFKLAAKWVGVTLPDSFRVNIHSDFAIGARAAEDIKNLLAMRVAGQITHRTFLTEIRRRALIGEDVDIEQEVEDVENESSTNGLTGVEDPPGNDPNSTPPGEEGGPARTAA